MRGTFSKRASVLLVTLALGACAKPIVASAPTGFDQARAEASEDTEGVQFFAGAASYAPRNHTWWVAGFGSLEAGVLDPDARFFVARRSRGGLEGTVAIEWADGRTCSALHDVLVRLATLKASQIELPWTNEFAYFVDAEGTTVTLWGRGSVGRVEFEGNGGDIGAWGDAFAALPANCWSAAKPVP